MEKTARKNLRLPEHNYSENGGYFFTVCTQGRSDIFGKVVIDAVGGDACRWHASIADRADRRDPGPRPARTESARVNMNVSPAGQIVWDVWLDLPNHNENIELGPFIVMPDHIHGIVFLTNRNAASKERAGLGPAPTALSEIIRQLKSFSARRVNVLLDTPGRPLWQRSFYERILRNQNDFNAAAQYIQENPMRWAAKYPYLLD